MSNRRIWSILAITIAMMCTTVLHSQEISLKTNLLYGATTTPNLGVEVGVGRKMTAQIFYGFNPWKFSGSEGQDKKLKHWLLMPELRWWTCTKMNGWFYGVHAMGGQFNAANVKLPLPGTFFGGDDLAKEVRNYRCEGAYLGGGVTVGYQWILSRHWNIEAEIGAGYDHIWYKKYPCSECSALIDKASTNYIGITKAGLCLMYVF